MHINIILLNLNIRKIKPKSSIFIMNTNLTEKEKLNHPYYRIMQFKGEALDDKLNSWSRLELIDWLCWNDRNGVYTDEDSLREFGNTLTKQRAIEIITEMITQEQNMTNTNIESTSNRQNSEILESRVKIGSSLRAIRENRGWSQEQLAEKMNISRSTISKIESGKFNCSIDYLAKFATFLNFEVNLSQLKP